MTYPIAEYAQADPLLQNQSAATGVHVYRSNEISQLSGLILFGDNPSGEIFAVSADDPPSGGQSAIRRVLLGADGQTLMDLIHTADAARGRSPANRADLRFGSGANGRVYILNKRDGIVRLLVPGTNQ